MRVYWKRRNCWKENSDNAEHLFSSSLFLDSIEGCLKFWRKRSSSVWRDRSLPFIYKITFLSRTVDKRGPELSSDESLRTLKTLLHCRSILYYKSLPSDRRINSGKYSSQPNKLKTMIERKHSELIYVQALLSTGTMSLFNCQPRMIILISPFQTIYLGYSIFDKHSKLIWSAIKGVNCTCISHFNASAQNNAECSKLSKRYV